jgi:hypothetical protein
MVEHERVCYEAGESSAAHLGARALRDLADEVHGRADLGPSA